MIIGVQALGLFTVSRILDIDMRVTKVNDF